MSVHTPPSSPSGPRPSRPRLEGRRLGRYQILAHVAAGGMASVYAARHEGTFGFERIVALKVLHPHLAGEEEFLAMFVDEARLAARIRHPKVVSVLDVADDPSEGLYLVMEYVEGDHLGNLTRAASALGERIPARVVLRIVLDLLEGLEAAHGLVDDRGVPTPIAHRDCSPHNLLVGVDGVARLADFGIARAEARLTRTETGKYKGKLGYMAPEQLMAGGGDVRSDLFSAGVVLYEALTGQRLFRGESPADTIRMLLVEPIPSVAAVHRELAPLAPVVERALARVPDERFAAASAMAEALWAVAPGVGGVATPREVGEFVRARRGDAIERVSARIRDAAVAPRDIDGVRRDVTTAAGRTPASIDAPSSAPRSRRALRVRAALGAVAIAAVSGVALAALPTARVEGGASRPASADRLVADDGDPSLLSGAPPVLPSSDLPVSPTIVVRVHVGADGAAVRAEPYQPRPGLEALERVAAAAARGYRYRPAMRGGRAVAGTLNLPVRFEREVAEGNLVRIKGSDTIGAVLAPALAEAFRELRPDVRVEIEALGSSTAFVGLFDGSADLGAASRPIREAEANEAARLGIGLEETVVGYDGIAIVVHPSRAIESLTLEQVARIFGGRTRTFVDGSRGRIRAIGRPSYSGTHGFFEDHVLEPFGLSFAAEVESIEHTEDIVAAVAADPSAIAYVGAAYVTPEVKVVPLAPRAGAPSIAPSEATIRDGTYPIYRPLLVYSRGAPSGSAGELLRFMLSDRGRAIVRAHGFVPSAAALPESSPAAADPSRRRSLERIVFPLGSTRLTAEGQAAVRRIARDALASPSARVFVTGHADAEGTEPENERIGRERARATATALASQGVPSGRIEVETRGSSAPIATNGTEEGRGRNRRADVVVLY